MAATKVLLDTGPLVAYLNSADQWHQWVKERWDEIYTPMETCEPVLSESVFLLQQAQLAISPLLQLLERKILLLSFDLKANFPDIKRLLLKYEDQPMSLADACLVRMAERTENCQVFTFDSDFRIYRRHGRGEIPLLAPPAR